MKKVTMVFLAAALLFVLAISTAWAGGGQVRGENGQGAVHQVQVQDPPPFQP